MKRIVRTLNDFLWRRDRLEQRQASDEIAIRRVRERQEENAARIAALRAEVRVIVKRVDSP